MIKTKFKVEIYANGNHSIDLLRMIGNHNAGEATLTIRDIEGFVAAVKAKGSYTFDRKGAAITASDNPNKLLISDDNGETFYLAIEVEIEVNYPPTAEPMGWASRVNAPTNVGNLP